MFKTLAVVAGGGMVLAGGAFALPHENCGEEASKAVDCSKCHSLTVEEANRLLKGVGEVKGVRGSAVKGLFELTIENKGQRAVAYVDFAKKNLMPGPIFDIATRKVVTGTSDQQPKPAAVNIDSIPTDSSIVMGNPKGKKRLFVFTDPDCPFCAKLHWELVKLIYMEPDLAIYVKMYPLKMHPGAHDKARVILGAKSQYLLDKAFSGEALPAPGANDPAKPVDDTIKFADSIGINATPTLVLPDGRIMPGFRDAAAIKKLLSEGAK